MSGPRKIPLSLFLVTTSNFVHLVICVPPSNEKYVVAMIEKLYCTTRLALTLTVKFSTLFSLLLQMCQIYFSLCSHLQKQFRDHEIFMQETEISPPTISLPHGATVLDLKHLGCLERIVRIFILEYLTVLSLLRYNLTVLEVSDCGQLTLSQQT